MKVNIFTFYLDFEGCKRLQIVSTSVITASPANSRLASDRYVECLQQAKDVGEIPSHLDVCLLADFCVNSWEGALQQMKVSESCTPLQTFITIVFDVILKG